MFKKLILCLLLVLSLVLVACGSDKEDTANNQSTTGTVADASGNDTGSDASTSDSTSSDDTSDKNEVGNDKLVTEGTGSTNTANIYNVGGIEFEVPEGSVRQSVFVGAGLTFEVRALQGMIRSFYFDQLEGNFVVEDVPSFVTGSEDKTFETGFVARYLDKYEKTDDTVLTVAGFQARKITYKGTSNGDCYRDGPVKNLVDATLETVCIYNDVEGKLIVVMSLCKSGKAADMDKSLTSVLANAQSKATESTIGLYGDSHAEVGGFAFEVPAVYGALVDCAYETYGESYEYYYGSKTNLSNNLGWGVSMLLSMSRFADDGMMGGMMGGFAGGNGGEFGGDFGDGADLGNFDGAGGDFGGAGGNEGFGGAGGNDGFGGAGGDFGGNDGFGGGDFGGGFGGMGGMFGGDDLSGVFSEDDMNWLNVIAVREVFTKDEFATALEGLKENVPSTIARIISESNCTQKEKITVDGMEGIRFTFTGNMGEQPVECKIILINNIKDRFIVVLTSFYDAERSDLASAFEELSESLKLVQ